MSTITAEEVAQYLPTLRQDANKYTRGVCELAVGTSRFPGAGVLAATAAARMGAGYLNVYTCPETAAALHVALPSAVTLPLAQYKQDFHAQSESHPRASVVGCGMCCVPEDLDMAKDVLEYTAGPVLIDGGSFSAFSSAEVQESLRTRFLEGYPTVITPHEGEAGRLLHVVERLSHAATDGAPHIEAAPEDVSRVGFVRENPAQTAMMLARAFGSVCVLKGPNTYIADGNEERPEDVRVMDAGTPVLAKAGTGDVLAGCIGALLAQGVEPKAACMVGTFAHAQAGVLAAAEVGDLCVTAEDVVAHLPAAVRFIAAARMA